MNRHEPRHRIPPPLRLAAGAYWALDAREVAEGLGATLAGLSNEQARSRLSRLGSNVLATRRMPGIVHLFLRQLANPLVLILVIAAVVAGAVGEEADSGIIVVVLLGSALLMLSQEYRAVRAVERLRSRLRLHTTALRDGEATEIPAEEVVPGDVILLSAGSLVPADGLVLQSRDLFVNQSVLTGESFPVEKSPGTAPAEAPLPERTGVAFMGTSVRSGTGRMLVVATGRDTVYGQIAKRLALRPPETEFERGLRRFGYLLGRVIALLVVLVFAANVFLDRPPVEALLFAIALAVGISPELLPAIVSVTLSHGARSMAEQGVIVRRLMAIEDFGSMDVLCADKTGTLTEGVIRLVDAVDPEGRSSRAVLEIAGTNARLQTGIRNPLDEAILAAGTEAATSSSMTPTPPRKLDEIPYDFVRRRVTVAISEGDGARLLTKGAVPEVLHACGHVARDASEALTSTGRRALEARAADWGAQGYRVLAVATKPVERRSQYAVRDEDDLTLEGFLLFEDRPREGIRDILGELRRLGVAVKIVTGDSRHVASHVAAEVGLDGDALLTGEEMDKTRNEALWRLAERTAVFAEVDPHQKERIIVALRKTGHVVGYLGDGINDAPALHAADVGISVETAADVARESADLVLVRHDLDVLRQGIIEGRTTFANTLKYVHITTSANFGNMFSMAAASFFLPFLPLLATQILLNNFLSDLPGVALTRDRVDEDWITRPRRWQIGPLRRFMVAFGLVSSAFDVLAFGLLLLLFGTAAAPFRTGWFVFSVLTELAIVFVARTPGPMLRSRPSATLAATTAFTALVALALPFTPIGRMFALVPLSPVILAPLLLLTLAYVIASEVTKRWFYRFEAR